MIDLTPISETIQKRLFEKSIILGREKSSPNNLVSLGGLDLNKLSMRSTFIRMVSGLEVPVILMGGELKPDGGMMAGYKDIYGPRVGYDTDKNQKNAEYNETVNEHLEIGNITQKEANPMYLGTSYTKSIPNPFKRPMPGIKSANINFKGGARALREATVSWTCWSFNEIERLMPHFLSVGKTVLLEWGWVYGKDSLSNIPTFIGPNGRIRGDAYTDYKNTVIEAKGDFDMMIGIVKNFEFNTRDDGGFDCQTVITSVGTNILENVQPTESSLSYAVNFDLSNEDSAEVTAKKLEDAKDDPNKLVTLDVGVSLKVFIKHIDKYIADKISIFKNLRKEAVAEGASTSVRKNINEEKYGEQIKIIRPDKKLNPHYFSFSKNQFIIEYGEEALTHRDVINEVHNVWVRWGWFEDNILSKFLSLVSNGTEATAPEAEFRSVKRLEEPDGKETKIYESVRIKNHKSFQTIDISKYILPSQFTPLKKPTNVPEGIKGDSKYMEQLAQIVNSENFKPFAIEGVDYESMSVAEKIAYKIEVGAAAGFSGESEVITIEATGEQIVIPPLLGEKDRKQLIAKLKRAAAPESLDFSQGYLRNMLINTKLIKEAFGVSDDDEFTVESINVREALEHMFALLNQSLHFWNLEITNDETEPYRSKIVDRNITVPLPDKEEKINDLFVNKPGTRSIYSDGQVKNRGVFFFPVWTHDSIVKRQNIRATIPNAMAVSIMYGANADQAKTLGTSPSEVGSQEGELMGNLGKNSPADTGEKEKNISIVLNQEGYKNYGAPSSVDDNIKLTKKGGDDDLKTWIVNNADLISEKYQSKTEKTKKYISAQADAVRETEINEIIDNSIPPPMPEDLLKHYPTAFSELGEYEGEEMEFYTKTGDQKTPEFVNLYSSKYDNTGKMKQPFIDSIQYDITNLKVTETTITETSKPLLLPLELELDVDGIGGIFPGNSFHSTYLPMRYQQETLFQVFDVGHTVDSSGWTTSIRGKMRSTAERLKDIKVEKVLDKLGIKERFLQAKASSNSKELRESINTKLEGMTGGTRQEKMRKLRLIKDESGLSKAERALLGF